MPARKKQAPPQPSDYETDAPLDLAPPAPRSNYELNLSVLRRHVPSAIALHHVSPYAVLYTFSLTTSQWEKVGIEGTLFIIQLTPSLVGAERYGVVILNRRGLENFHMELKSAEEVEITDDYIILHGAEEVVGLWIFSEEEGSTKGMRLETAEKILELSKAAADSRAEREESEEEGTNGAVAEESEAEGGVPMGRQVSLRELFGQQRAQDAAWSVHQHNGGAPMMVPEQGQEPTRQQVQINLLDQMFMSARQDYNGVG
ncbi:PH domain-like protein [Amniculicola lignicola CBS 123094]|uniref:PH domain-like protein n=1 Tax=Amniculicola lignicola CBS 123094 TaxID=1392246 RepID=A0A6A5WDG6_9PLEO|nr:PH domain-like protein [Amniculicola lignicola CBS 123094]